MTDKPTLLEFVDKMYQLYKAQARAIGTVTCPIDPVADELIRFVGVKTRQELEPYLEQLLIACLRHEVPYGLMLEVDATWASQAAWNRRKRSNQIWVFDRPVRIMEMSRRKE